jgi:hypothetical protein
MGRARRELNAASTASAKRNAVCSKELLEEFNNRVFSASFS